MLDEPLLHDDSGAPVGELAIAVEAHARGAALGGALLDALARDAPGAVAGVRLHGVS